MNLVEEAMASIQVFVSKTLGELRDNLLKAGMPEEIGDNFDIAMVPGYVPSTMIVRPGLYECCDGKTNVEVLKQDTKTGLIHLQVYDEEDPFKRFEFISTGMFVRLFRPRTPIAYVMGRPPSQV